MTNDAKHEIEFLIRCIVSRRPGLSLVAIVAEVAREFGHNDERLAHAHDYAKSIQR